MTHVLILMGLFVGGFLGMFVLHFMIIIFEFNRTNNYLMRFSEVLLKRVPGPISFLAILSLITVSMLALVFVMLAVTESKDVNILYVYISGAGIYLILVPLRLTFFPFILKRLFPKRKFVD